MEELNIYKLRFISPLHISNTRSDYSISNRCITSDTMYAAITSCLAKLGESIPTSGDLGFTISTLFPYYQKNKDDTPLYFFPKPMLSKLPTVFDKDNVKDTKKVKKIQWVDDVYFSKILSGDNFSNEFTNDIKGEYLTKSKDFDKNKSFIESKVAQRIRIKDRTMQDAAEPYWVDRIFFKDYSGLYFIVQGDTKLLDRSLSLLALEGIGTDRNIGNGIFEFEKGSIQLNLPDASDYCVNLSIFFPETKEQLTSMIGEERIAYDILRRGGWITDYPHQTLRKNYIYGFTQSSVFKKKTKGLETVGRIVDLRPKWKDNLHHIWRCGRTLVLPINI